MSAMLVTSSISWTTRITGTLLQCIVYGIMVYSWYIYVLRLCVILLIATDNPNVPLGGVLIAFGSLLSLMATISYTRILFTDPGYPCQEPIPQMAEAGTIIQNDQSNLPKYCYSPSLLDESTLKPLPLQDTTMKPALSISLPNGTPRYCEFCCCFKPNRTHHCSDCNACVLKMDHHCPWINNCVGHHNHKFFFLFLFYTGLYGLWCLGTGIPLVVIVMHDPRTTLDPHWIAFLVLAFIIGVSVSAFCLNHLRFILLNRTTLENVIKQADYVRVDFDLTGLDYQVVLVDHPERLWDMGKLKNWKIVMGDRFVEWFIPISNPVGDGTIYPFSDSSYQQILDRVKR